MIQGQEEGNGVLFVRRAGCLVWIAVAVAVAVAIPVLLVYGLYGARFPPPELPELPPGAVILSSRASDDADDQVRTREQVIQVPSLSKAEVYRFYSNSHSMDGWSVFETQNDLCFVRRAGMTRQIVQISRDTKGFVVLSGTVGLKWIATDPAEICSEVGVY